jgi:preprotein translocase subunit SecE
VTVGSDALAQGERGWLARVRAFTQDVTAELHKVTWPTRDDVKKATLAIVVFVALLGVTIGLMDWLLQLMFVKLPARVL